MVPISHMDNSDRNRVQLYIQHKTMIMNTTLTALAKPDWHHIVCSGSVVEADLQNYLDELSPIKSAFTSIDLRALSDAAVVEGYRMGEIIGTGAFSVVKKADHILTGQKVSSACCDNSC